MEKLFFLIGFCIVSIWSYGQKFYVQVATNTLPLGQTMEIMYTAENIHSDDIQLPNFKDFKVVGGPNISTSTSIVNTSISETKSWSFYLQALHVGICKIEPAAIVTNKGKLFTKEVIINVSGANTNSTPIPNTSNTSNTSNTNGKFVFKLLSNKKSVYVGEDIMLTYKLYIQDAIEGGNIMADFHNANFTVLNTYNKKEDQLVQDELLDGKAYSSVIIQKIHINALKSGNHKIESLPFNLKIKNKNSSFIEQFFGDEYEDILLKSNEINIEVKELPNPIPANFNEAIGDFSINCSLNKSSANTNEPITLKVKISGTGNLKNVTPPQLQLASYFELYEPQLTQEITLNNNESSGDLIYEYIITPHEPGNFHIKTPVFKFYNIQQNAYESIGCDSIPIIITGNSTPYNYNKSATSKDLKLDKIQEIIGTNNEINHAIISSPFYYLFLSSPILLMLMMLVYSLYTKKKNQESQEKNNLRNILAKIETLKNSTNAKEVYKECNQTLISVLTNRFSKQDISTNEKLQKVLIHNQIDSKLIDEILNFIQSNEKNIYIPFEVDIDKNVIEKLKELVIKING